MILSEDEDRITIMLPDADRPVAIPKERIRDRRLSSVSGMPDGLLDTYDLGKIADLLAFLQQGPGTETTSRP